MVGFLLAGVLQGVSNSSGPYSAIVKQFLAGVLGLVAITLLSWMLVWMSQQAKSIKSDVETAIKKSTADESKAQKGVFMIVFIAVLREGFETVIFIAAQLEKGWLNPSIGAFAGLFSAAFLAILLFKWGVKIDIRRFFKVMGVFLILIVGGLVIGVLNQF